MKTYKKIGNKNLNKSKFLSKWRSGIVFASLWCSHSSRFSRFSLSLSKWDTVESWQGTQTWHKFIKQNEVLIFKKRESGAIYMYFEKPNQKCLHYFLLVYGNCWNFDRWWLFIQAFQKIIIWNCSLKFMNSPDTNVRLLLHHSIILI